MTWLDSITNTTDMNVSKLREVVKGREAWCANSPCGFRAGHELATAGEKTGYTTAQNPHFLTAIPRNNYNL